MSTKPPHISVATTPAAEELHAAHFVWERGCVGSLLGLVTGPLSAIVLFIYLPAWLPYPINIWIAVSLGSLIISAFQGVFIRNAIPVRVVWLIISTLSWFGLAVSLSWLYTHNPVLTLCGCTLANGITSIGQYALIRGRLASAWQWVLMNTVLGVLLWSAPLVIIGFLA